MTRPKLCDRSSWRVAEVTAQLGQEDRLRREKEALEAGKIALTVASSAVSIEQARTKIITSGLAEGTKSAVLGSLIAPRLGVSPKRFASLSSLRSSLAVMSEQLIPFVLT